MRGTDPKYYSISYVTHTRNSIGWQFSSSKHDVTEVKSGVVNSTELLVRMISRVKILEWRLNPTKAGQVAAGQHVDIRSISVHDLLMTC